MDMVSNFFNKNGKVSNAQFSAQWEPLDGFQTGHHL
jgi:hypothetical protein